MDLNDLPRFAPLQERRFKKMDAGKHTDLERVYAQLAKLGEEVGELCEQVLAADGHQRTEKADKYNREKLAAEFADVVIVTFILAEKMKVDLPDALEKKIAVVNERFKNILA